MGKYISKQTAIIYCEANFGKIDGKTANGLIRQSQKYQILSVIDSEKTGLDSGEVLDNKSNSIPIYSDLSHALSIQSETPSYFIFGMAPSSGLLSNHERAIVLEAMSFGMNIVNGLHEFLNDDPVFAAACLAHGVTIDDIRKPKDIKDLKIFRGLIHQVKCPRIAVLGTDCAIGKRTTATILTQALNDAGIKTTMIGTGQTSKIQGAPYGISLDAIPSQFCSGEIEATIVSAYENERPDVIVIEGQSSLSHPAFSSSAFILRGACPTGVVLQHAPKRLFRCDFEEMRMPKPEFEINLIETFSDTQVIGLTINHENMNPDEIQPMTQELEFQLKIPCTDALSQSSSNLVKMVLRAYPHLHNKPN